MGLAALLSSVAGGVNTVLDAVGTFLSGLL